MSEVKTDYLPLDEAESPELSIVLPIPGFVNWREILVGIKPMHILFSIAGIDHLRVQAADSDETSDFQPIVVGFNSEGEAYAAKSGLKTVNPAYSFKTQHHDNESWYRRGVKGTVNINIDEMARQITQEKIWTQGLRSSGAWAHHLDKALKGSIRGIGLRHLLFDFTRADLLTIGSVQASSMLFAATPEALVRNIIALNLLMNSTIIFMAVSSGNPVRPSLIYGPQLDRAAIFAGYLATHHLVKIAPQ